MVPARKLERPIRVRNPRIARAATLRRIRHKSRARYSSITRVGAAIGGLLFLFMIYVLLTSMLTGLSYAVAKAEHQRENVLEETMRLDDRIAALRSDDRLSVLAMRLKMAEPQRFAVVRLSRPPVALEHPHVAMLSSLAGFIIPVVSGH
ncbi:MAG: hypothetical protein JOY69_04350 [Candidatus Eremiobacteraeota bacterium]|nr:hypothetical protein [Candidatus Eremiobacteraeota bacterium]MBV8372469.1 hypothetical protein [Candidatus Eremiobacteraeota bacterium]